MRLTYPSSVSLPSNEICSEPFISFEAQILLILLFFFCCCFFGVIRYIKVAELSEGGPAEKAGVKAGDILVSIEGKSLFGITIDGLAKLFQRFPCTYALNEAPVGNESPRAFLHFALAADARCSVDYRCFFW